MAVDVVEAGKRWGEGARIVACDMALPVAASLLIHLFVGAAMVMSLFIRDEMHTDSGVTVIDLKIFEVAAPPKPPGQIAAALKAGMSTPGAETFGPWPWDAERLTGTQLPD